MSVAVHEAGHAVVAWRLDHRLGWVTVEPGRSFDGCQTSWPAVAADPTDVDPDVPPPLWPAAARRNVEAEVMVLLAGDLAAELFARPTSGYRSPQPAERVIDQLPEPTDGERHHLANAQAEESYDTDDARALALAVVAFGGHRLAAAAPWLTWLQAEARALLTAHADDVLRLADALESRRTLGGDAVYRVLTAV